nr:glycosyltransferase [uncultured Shimia sp.]
MATPCISVIMPIYNVQAYVADCIKSLQLQIFEDFEAILIDDGSTDQSLKIAKGAIANDERFTIIQQAHTGLSAARNIGLERATGEAIAFLDSDDQLAPDFLQRLWSVMQETDADWVACALQMCGKHGNAFHPAIHGQHDLHACGVARIALTDWRDVVCHFPSAWNKLYRRSLIEGVRFTDGTWFEDHEFFYQVACRTDHLIYVSDALYLHRRDRAGQITDTDSDRVFNQFAVLDRLWEVMRRAPKSHAAEAYQQVTQRLLYERSLAVHAPERRARFVQSSAEFLRVHQTSNGAGGEQAHQITWQHEIQGHTPTSVVIPYCGEPELLAQSLEAVASPVGIGVEVLVIVDAQDIAAKDHAFEQTSQFPNARVIVQPDAGLGSARNYGAQQALGTFVVFLDAGDIVAAHTLAEWCNMMLQEDADLGVSQFRVGVGEGTVHGGFHDETCLEGQQLRTGVLEMSNDIALCLHCHPSAKIFRRAFMQEHEIHFGARDFGDWSMVIQAALRAKRVLYFAWPGVEVSESDEAKRVWRTPLTASALVAAHDNLLDSLWPLNLPQGWQARLFLRAVWEKWHFARPKTQLGQKMFLAGVVLAGYRRGYGPRQQNAPTTIDPYVSEKFAQLLRPSSLAKQGASVAAGRLFPLSTEGWEEVGKLPNADGMLRLTERMTLEMRVVLPKSQAPAASTLSFDGSEIVAHAHIDVLRTVDAQVVTLEFQVPGRVWKNHDRGAALNMAVVDSNGVAVGQASQLTQTDLQKTIEEILRTRDLCYEPQVAMLVIEHVRFAGFVDRLCPEANRALGRVVAFFRLSDFLHADVQTDARPPAQNPPQQPFSGQALRRFSQTVRSDPGIDPVILFSRLAKGLAAADQQDLYLGLSEYFCGVGRDFHGFYRVAGSIATRVPRQDGSWEKSAMLPTLYLQDRVAEVRETLWSLVPLTDQWVVTPAVAWVTQQATDDWRIDEQDREDILYAFVEFVDRRAAQYWERAQCEALLRAAMHVLCHLNKYAGYVHPHFIEFVVRVYGLSFNFWDRVREVARQGEEIPTELRSALMHADVIRAHENATEPELEQALAYFTDAKNVDVDRFRRELSLHTGEARDCETKLRRMAHPNGPHLDEFADEVATALPSFYPDVPQAPYFELQIEASKAAGEMVAKIQNQDEISGREIDALWSTLSVLSGERSQFLGLGVALTLIAEALNEAEIGLVTEFWRRFKQITPENAARWTAAPAVQAPIRRLLACTDDKAKRWPEYQEFVEVCSARGAKTSHAQTAEYNTSAWRGNPVFDTIVVVFSCERNLTTRIPKMRSGWLGLLEALGVPYIVVVGGGQGEKTGDVVSLDAPDDYEGLPQKTLAAIRWVYENTDFEHLLKIDDDCFLNAPEFFHSLSYRKFDYYGRVLKRTMGQMDRAWHCSKATSERGSFELDKSPEPSTYADGGTAYCLSRHAMHSVIAEASTDHGGMLIDASFMEDKMVGDLLVRAGIVPENEDYRVSIKRKPHPTGMAVSMWGNSFEPSRAAPVKLVHLDDEYAQIPSLERLGEASLWPKKVWPSFQNVALGFQSNTLELISSVSGLDCARDANVAVVACVRNEMFMLPHFLAHYRKMGVEAFLIADNCSDDGTLEYLADQPDVSVFSVDTDYNLSYYGVAWQQALMANFRVGKWSLVADADELLFWEPTHQAPLENLLSMPDFQGADAARVFMLDMYPKGALECADFRKLSPFDQAGFVDQEPFLANVLGQGPYSNMKTWTSALRHRLMPGSRSDLFVAQKVALLKYQPWMQLSAGLHFVNGVNFAQRDLLFGHFKYNSDFRQKAQQEAVRQQHFNNAEEYAKYANLMSEGRSKIFTKGISVPWNNCTFVNSVMGRTGQLAGVVRPHPTGSTDLEVTGCFVRA